MRKYEIKKSCVHGIKQLTNVAIYSTSQVPAEVTVHLYSLGGGIIARQLCI